MKNAQKVNKAIRGLLICAMAFILSGVTLNKVFASYYEINVEHIFIDHSNGTTNLPEGIPNDKFTPRDDLIDDLSTGEGSGGLTVEVNDANGNFETSFDVDGTKTGNSVGYDEALKVMDELLKQAAEGDKDATADLKEKFQEIQKRYDEVQNPDESETWKGKIPSKPDYAPAPVVSGEEPTFDEPEPELTNQCPNIEDVENGTMTQEEYNELYRLYLDEFNSPEYQEAYIVWSTRKDDIEHQKAEYDQLVAEYNEWLEEHPNGLEEWDNYNDYQADLAAYYKELEKISKDLFAYVNNSDSTENGGDSTKYEATDKNLTESYQLAYMEVFQTILKGVVPQTDEEGNPQTDEEGNPITVSVITTDEEGNTTINLVAAKKVLDSMKESFQGLGGEILEGDVKVDTWVSDTTSGREMIVDLFKFSAMLDKEDQAALGANGYSTSETPFKITIVCLKYKVEEKKDEDGNIVYEFEVELEEVIDEKTGKPELDGEGNKIYKPVHKEGSPNYVAINGEDGKQITATYVSIDNGKNWYDSSDFDENCKLKPGAKPIDTEEVQTKGGYITQAVTYTFQHVWNPDVGNNSRTPSGDTPNPLPPEKIEEPEVPTSEEPPAEEPPVDEEIEEPDVPLADIPETGDISDLWYGAALVLAAGLAVLLYQERRSRKTA